MVDASTIERADFHLKIVQEISDFVNQSHGLDTILKEVVHKIGDALHFEVVSIYLWDEAHQELVLKSTRGLRNPSERPIRLKSHEGLTGLVFETLRPLVVIPASAHPRYKYFPESGEEEFESYIGVPIILQNKCLGVLVAQTREKIIIPPAVEALFQIIASRLAGLLEVTDKLERLESPRPDKLNMHAFQGKVVSGGFAVGQAFLLRHLFREVSTQDFQSAGVEDEITRLSNAIGNVENDLRHMIQDFKFEGTLSEGELNIFEAHLEILGDFALRNAIVERIKEKKESAERSVIEGMETIIQKFESHKQHFVRERTQDFRDIRERILHHLLRSRGKEYFTPCPQNSIIVAYDLGPSLLAMLHKNKIAAMVTEKGGETSHAAILARSLGIPFVAGIENVCKNISSGETLLVDGKTGFVFVNPDKALIQEYEMTHRQLVHLREEVEKEVEDCEYPAVSVTLTANVGFPSDVRMAQHYHLKDADLFRTEFAFMQSERWPTVPEQVKIYEEVGKHFEGYVTIRTLDVGGDKLLPYFTFPKEENPLLGLRSIRFSMENLDPFRDQIKAILLAMIKGHRFRILFPMISHLWEMETARKIVEQAGKELGISATGLPPLGILLEVPAVLFQLEDFKDWVDFISIGTNDLTQYLLAVDRNSNVVGHLYSSLHPSVLRTLNWVLNQTKDWNKKLTICGELAGTAAGALALVAMGYRQFGVLPSRAPIIRHLCRHLTPELLEQVKSQILTEKRESEIRRFLDEVLTAQDPRLVQLD